MRRFSHGGASRASIFQAFSTNLTAFKATFGAASLETDFVYMFPTLRSPADKLPPTPDTVLALKQLATAMTDLCEDLPGRGATGPGDSRIPAGYTYFGQFLDHDITFDKNGLGVEALADPNLQPLASLSGLTNARASVVDLDSVYAAPASARNGDRMVIGDTFPLNGTTRPLLRPAGKSPRNDLPRQPRNSDKDLDRAAQIGDPRNDENTIVAQMHLAFLKAHNSLVDDGANFDDARKGIILRYQTIVLNDFLKRVCDPVIVDDILNNGPRFWTRPRAPIPPCPSNSPLRPIGSAIR